MKKNKTEILIWCIIIFATILNITLIFNDSIWGDEGYTMLMLKKNFVEIVKETAIDVHPPLYYFIAKIFTIILGYSVSVVKLVSILPVILTMIFVKIKSKKLFKESTLITILFSILIAFCPQAFKMNVELRMYTWAMFFVTCSGIYAYEIYKQQNKKSIILFIIVSLCAAYTHYYAAVTEGFIYLFLVIALLLKNKKEFKNMLTIIGTTIIGYLPWIPVLIKQFFSVKQDWWVTSLPGETLLNSIKFLFNGEFTNIFLILFAIIIVELIIYTIKTKDKEAIFATLSITCAIAVVASGIILSKLIRPLFIERYLYPSAGLLFLGISIGITKSNYKELLRNALVGLIVINLFFSFYNAKQREYKTGTEEFKNFAKENIKQEDIIYTDIPHFSWTILPYYLPNNNIKVNLTEIEEGYVVTEKKPEIIQTIINNKQINQVYYGTIDARYTFYIYKVE